MSQLVRAKRNPTSSFQTSLRFLGRNGSHVRYWDLGITLKFGPSPFPREKIDSSYTVHPSDILISQ